MINTIEIKQKSFPVGVFPSLTVNTRCIYAQVIADTHGTDITIEKDVDMYILLGDNDGPWLFDLEHISIQKNKPVLCILGNHDDPHFLRWHPDFIHSSYYEYMGISMCCIDGCVKKDNMERYIGYTQFGYNQYIGEMPVCDIILSHTPPAGIFEPCDVAHQGILALKDKILHDQPSLCLYGHEHVNKVDWFGSTCVRGVYMSNVVSLQKRDSNS